MAFTIAIDEMGIGNDHVAYITFPANKKGGVWFGGRKIKSSCILRISVV